MDYKRIEFLIQENKDVVEFGEFGVGISDKWIKQAQSRLDVIFPPSYIWWLKNFSGGSINGEEVFSVYEIDFDTVVGGDIVYINELNRKNGITTHTQLTIQENDQGELYFLDLNEKGENGEYPVYIDITGQKYSDDFLSFIEKKIME